MAEKHVYGPFDHGVVDDFTRADIEFYGINHFRPSFSVQIYLNDTEVSVASANEKRPSYAGRFDMFGHDQCFGDEGHCEIPTLRRRFDDRPSHPLTPAFRRVEVTNALKKVFKKSKKLTVTVVVTSKKKYKPPKVDPKHKHHGHAQSDKLFDIKGMQLVTYG